ncbi:MAG: hypothetical protein ABI036_07225 [Fibrobacteria bacterium]
MDILAVNRLACIDWQLQHIRSAAGKLGVTKEFFNKKGGIFGGRTLSDIMRLLRAARKTIVPPSGVFDGSVMLASGTALLIEGVQYLDKIGVVDAPILHTNLHDAVSALPLEHAHGIADSLGGVGLINFSDLLGDALLVFSAFKSLFNLARAEDLGSKASDVRSEASRLQVAQASVRAVENRAMILASELEERSYEAYKWAIVAEEAAKLHHRKPTWQIPQLVVARLRDATVRLWANLQQPAAA